MKTLQMLMLFAAAACAVVGCGDHSIEGLDANGVSVDASDDAFTVYGDVEPKESLPHDGEASDENVWNDTADVPTVAEYCAPYLGTWDCVCDQGSCCKGCSAWHLLEPLQVNDKTWTILVTREGGSSWTITCDPQHPPPSDYIYCTFEMMESGNIKYTELDFDRISVDYTSVCTRLY